MELSKHVRSQSSQAASGCLQHGTASPPPTSKAGEQCQLLERNCSSWVGEMTNTEGHGERGRAGLKRKVRQGQKNPL